MLTLELLFSLGLAAVAFGSFLGYFHSIRKQQTDLAHFASATFLLQSTMEEVRAGAFAASLDGLNWVENENGSGGRWQTSSHTTGGFSWHLASETKPVRGELFPFKLVVTWDERGKKRSISAATEWMPR